MKHTRGILAYPKLLCFLLSCVLAYLLHHQGAFEALGLSLNHHGYVSMFFGGLLFSFGFTTPFALAIFIDMAPHVHPVIGAVLAGSGALLSDLCIFKFVRFSFRDELQRLSSNPFFSFLRARFHFKKVPTRLRTYLLWSVAGIIIASPLPDELGVSFLGGATDIEERKFGVFCFIFNALGIMGILLAARAAIG